MHNKERLEEEFEIENEEDALREYSSVASTIAANYGLIADELSEVVDLKSGLVVDVGTGLGDLAIEAAKRYPDFSVVGIDISQKALDIARDKAKKENLNNIRFQIGDIHNISFKDNCVDLVISHGVIHHLKNIDKAFSEIYRILKLGAAAYITDLRRDAPEDIVKEVANNLPESQARGFINSIKASYIPEELNNILHKLNIKDFQISDQKFSRRTIMKNRDRLRASMMRGVDYTKLALTILIKKN